MPDYWAQWNGSPLTGYGQYEVEAYIPYWSASDRSHAARYEIRYATGINTVVVDQHDVGQSRWISLGRYNFDPATAYVKVTDAAYVGVAPYFYSEPPNSYRKILVDALRWRRTG